MLRLQKVNLGPVTIAATSIQSALEYTEVLIRQRGNHCFCFCEASLLSSSLRDPSLRRVLTSVDAVFPDGIALVVLARLRGCMLPGRIPGPAFLLAAAEYGVRLGWRHFLYGGNPGVADKLAVRLQRDYPGIIIAGTYSPPFRTLSDAEELQTKRFIESARPDLLWVCLGSPKQEHWCAEHLGLINVPVMLAVGAAFDFHSGNRPWAPAWIRRIGMEWAFRAFTGDTRTFLRNVRCVSMVGLYLGKVALSRLWSGSVAKT